MPLLAAMVAPRAALGAVRAPMAPLRVPLCVALRGGLLHATSPCLVPHPGVAAAHTSAGGSGAPSAPTSFASAFSPTKLKAAVKENGAVGAGIYVALWVAPFSVVYTAARARDNFGVDPLALLDGVGAKEPLLNALSLPLDSALEPWQTAVVLGFVAADALELARLPATLFLAPRAKRWLDARRSGAAAAPPGAAAGDGARQ